MKFRFRTRISIVSSVLMFIFTICSVSAQQFDNRLISVSITANVVRQVDAVSLQTRFGGVYVPMMLLPADRFEFARNLVDSEILIKYRFVSFIEGRTIKIGRRRNIAKVKLLNGMKASIGTLSTGATELTFAMGGTQIGIVSRTLNRQELILTAGTVTPLNG